MTEQYDDERLAARLRSADPASSLPPADQAWVDRLLEDTMSNDLLTESRETGTRNRSPLTWLVAAAAAVIIVAAGVFTFVNDWGSDEPSSPPQAADPGPEPSVTTLTAPGARAFAARCAVPTADALAPQATAFDGTVSSIEDDVVTLTPSHWYAGGSADEVEVEAPPEVLGQLLTSVDFQEGARYLVTANEDGQVLVCGLSGRYTPRLAALYEQAFTG